PGTVERMRACHSHARVEATNLARGGCPTGANVGGQARFLRVSEPVRRDHTEGSGCTIPAGGPQSCSLAGGKGLESRRTRLARSACNGSKEHGSAKQPGSAPSPTPSALNRAGRLCPYAS